MREFKRITVDPQVHNGMACIRDTGITVSEVVSKIVHEKTAEETLLEYPNLEAADVQDALAYAVGDMHSQTLNWLHEFLVPLTSAKGGNDLIATKILTEEKQQFFQISVSENIERAAKMINYYSMLTRQLYGREIAFWEKTTLGDLFQSAQARNYISKSLQIINPFESVKVRSNGYLSAVFDYLTSGWGFYFDLKLPSSIVVNQPHPKRITFSISRNHKYPDLKTETLIHSMQDRSSPVWLVRKILNQHGSELQIEFQESTVIFRFDLEVLEDESN